MGGVVRDERGIAMIAVVVVGFILFSLVTATLVFAVNSLDVSRRDQDWNAALAAAEAGLDDYLLRLNADGGYWRYSATNLPPDGNRAFVQWTNIPGPSNQGRFRYDVDTSQLLTNGTIRIVSSGKVNDVVRSVESVLRRRNFLDYLYFTEYETLDPLEYPSDQRAWAQQNCLRHYYDRPGRDPRCVEINFFTRDRIRGPLHTNDALLVSGNPRFEGETSTSWNDPSGKRWRDGLAARGQGRSVPSWARNNDPAFGPPLRMPPNNTALKAEADPALGGQGCLYSGPTRITLRATGTMDVTSPFTPSGGSCGVGTNRPLPRNGVIYVENLRPNNPNAGCRTHPLGYPIANDRTTYSCSAGDVFVSGMLDGQLTIASENNIVVTGDLVYEDAGRYDDLLGLVANNHVQIYHPVHRTNGSNLSGSVSDLDIHAAILSVQHSFIVQNYSSGAPLGRLSVLGAIGQQFRGPVGTFSGNQVSTGYEKDYVYDQRLRYLSPPKFLDPVQSAWRVAVWSEIAPAHRP